MSARRSTKRWRDIEKHNPQLAGVLPQTYQIFNSTLLKELLKKVSEIPAQSRLRRLRQDLRILSRRVRPHGRAERRRVLHAEQHRPPDRRSFSSRFMAACSIRPAAPAACSCRARASWKSTGRTHRRNLAIHGQEKVGDTVALCRMNLAMHGLEGDIREAITYYDDPHNSTGRFDFVLANPPFNVNAVDKDRLKDEVGKSRRYPFGLPRTDNANYLWIQLFYSALNEKGRAGFVMANSASDARASEQEIRKQLIEAHAVDVMVAVGPNMFYTVTLPCTLWFLDQRQKKTPRADKVLFIDARHIYRQIDRAHRDWTEAPDRIPRQRRPSLSRRRPDFTLGGDEAKAKIEVDNLRQRKPKYRRCSGPCKAATIKEIEAQGWSLNPGRYVGVAPGEAVSDEDFKEQLEELNEELETLNAQARDSKKPSRGTWRRFLKREDGLMAKHAKLGDVAHSSRTGTHLT